MQLTEQQTTKPRLCNWKAVQQLEKEREQCEQVVAGIGTLSCAAGVIASPGFLLLAFVYRPLIRLTKITRIIEVMRTLLEVFGDQIWIYPCIDVPGTEPIDLLIIAPEKAYLLISIRSKSKKEDSKVIYNEANETLYTKHKHRGLRKWLPCPLVELSDYHAWLNKHRREFDISANAIRRYPVIKTLVLWKPMEVDRHGEHLYSKMGAATALSLSRKGTALVIEQEEILNFVQGCLTQSRTEAVTLPEKQPEIVSKKSKEVQKPDSVKAHLARPELIQKKIILTQPSN
jgi:hypothetical protein